MIPILYDSNEKNFISNGLCRLRDAISVTVTQERNGVFECDFEYPVDGANFELIAPGRIVGVTVEDSDYIQPFDIESYSRPIDGIVTFHCVHISYRLRGIPIYVMGQTVNTLTDAVAMLNAGQTPFNFSADFEANGYCSAFGEVPRTIRQILGGVEGSMLDTYGGEYKFDRFNVKLMKSRGILRDFSIRYGVNMVDFNDETDFAGTFNKCIPYWENDGQVIVANVVSSGVPMYNGRDFAVPLDLTDKFENQPTRAQLETMAAQIMASSKPYLPKQTITVDFLRLQDIYPEYKNLFKCELCDRINVVFPMYGMEGTYKIVKTVWDALEGRYLEMELGDLSPTLSEALGTGEGTTQTVPTIESGYHSFANVAAGTSADYEVTFSKNFATAPQVVAGLGSSLTAANTGNVSVTAFGISTTGFTLRVYNASNAEKTIMTRWVAV